MTDNELADGYAPTESFETGRVTAVSADESRVAIGTETGTVHVVSVEGRTTVEFDAPITDLAVGNRVYALADDTVTALSAAGTRVWSVDLPTARQLAALPGADVLGVVTDDDRLVGFDGETGREEFDEQRPYADVTDDPGFFGTDGAFVLTAWSFLAVRNLDGTERFDRNLDGAIESAGIVDDTVVVSLKDERVVGVHATTGDHQWERELSVTDLPDRGDDALLFSADDQLVSLSADGTYATVEEFPGGEVCPTSDGDLFCAVSNGTVSVYCASGDPAESLSLSVAEEELVPEMTDALDLDVRNEGDRPVAGSLRVEGEGLTLGEGVHRLDLEPDESATETIPVEAVSAEEAAVLTVEADDDLVGSVSLSVADGADGALAADAELAAVTDGVATFEVAVENEGSVPLTDVTAAPGDERLGRLGPGESAISEVEAAVEPGTVVPISVQSDETEVSIEETVPHDGFAVGVETSAEGFVDVRVENGTDARVADDLAVAGNCFDGRFERRVELPERGSLVLALRPDSRPDLVSVEATLAGLAIGESATFDPDSVEPRRAGRSGGGRTDRPEAGRTDRSQGRRAGQSNDRPPQNQSGGRRPRSQSGDRRPEGQSSDRRPQGQSGDRRPQGQSGDRRPDSHGAGRADQTPDRRTSRTEGDSSDAPTGRASSSPDPSTSDSPARADSSGSGRDSANRDSASRDSRSRDSGSRDSANRDSANHDTGGRGDDEDATDLVDQFKSNRTERRTAEATGEPDRGDRTQTDQADRTQIGREDSTRADRQSDSTAFASDSQSDSVATETAGPDLSAERTLETASPARTQAVRERFAVVNEGDEPADGVAVELPGGTTSVGTVRPGDRATVERRHSFPEAGEFTLPAGTVTAENASEAAIAERTLTVERGDLAVEASVETHDEGDRFRATLTNNRDAPCEVDRIGVREIGVWDAEDCRVPPGETVEWSRDIEAVSSSVETFEAAVEYAFADSGPSRWTTLGRVSDDSGSGSGTGPGSGSSAEGVAGLTAGVGDETRVSGGYGSVVLVVENQSGSPVADVSVEASGEEVSNLMYGGSESIDELAPGDQFTHFVDVETDGPEAAVTVALSVGDDAESELTLRGPAPADEGDWSGEVLEEWSVEWGDSDDDSGGSDHVVTEFERA